HASQPGEFLDALDVDGAPHAAWSPRRKANLVAHVVDPFAQAVDPPEAERFVHRLGPRDARLAGRPLVESDPQLVFAAMVARQPLPPGGGRGKEERLHRSDRAAFASMERNTKITVESRRR